MASVAMQLKCLAEAAMRVSASLDQMHDEEKKEGPVNPVEMPPAGKRGSIANNSTIAWKHGLRH